MAYTAVSDGDEVKFGERKWRDVPFLLLFLIQLAGVVGVLINSTTTDSESDDDDIIDSDEHTFWIYVAVIACGMTLAVLISLFYIRLLRTLAYFLIYMSFLVSIVVFAIGAAVAFGEGRVGFGIAFAILSGSTLIYFFLIRKNIKFAVVLVNAAADVIRLYPATLYACFFITFLQIPWFILWGVAAYYTLENFESDEGTPYIIFLVFSFYWTHEVCKNVVHVTVSGLFARWYFYSTTSMPADPTWKSFKEAATHSLGSICFGSLLIAIVKTIRDVVQKARGEGDNCCKRCLDCCLGCLGWIIDYFNSYTLTYVAMYGKNFCASARATTHLLKNNGVSVMINDSIVTHLMFMGSVAIGLLAACLGALIAGADGEDWVENAIIAAVVGYIVCALATEVVESGISSLFVCFAENPGQLERTHPELYHKFAQNYPGSISSDNKL